MRCNGNCQKTINLNEEYNNWQENIFFNLIQFFFCDPAGLLQVNYNIF